MENRKRAAEAWSGAAVEDAKAAKTLGLSKPSENIELTKKV